MALWMAVLEQAVKDARSLIRRARSDPELWNNPLFRSEVNALRRWFQAGSQQPGGFGFICDLMNMDAEHAVQRLDEKYLRHLMPVTSHPVPQADCPA